MQNLLSGFAALHQLAAQRGDGLHPKLFELAQRDARLAQQGAIPLNVQSSSSGPAKRFADQVTDGDTVTALPLRAANRPSEKTG